MTQLNEVAADARATLVTGAAGGIGHAVALAFLREGDRVVAVDRNSSDHIEDLTREFGGAFTFLEADITDTKALDRTFEEVDRRLGRLHVLVNCAGIMYKARLEEIEPARWERTFAVNVTAALFVAQRAISLIRRVEHGRIINISSMTAEIGIETYAPYSASKAALSNLTKVLALELAPEQITVNCICPGWVDTPMVSSGLIPHLAKVHRESETAARDRVLSLIPQGRLVHPDEVAFAALYLAHPMSQAVTGASLMLDGGITASLLPGTHRGPSWDAAAPVRGSMRG